MTEKMYISGKCFCGQISVEGRVSKHSVVACHCKDCQKFSGAPFRSIAVIPKEDLIIIGEVTEYQKIADSGNARLQGFCGRCGTQLYATGPDKELFNVRAGFLDQHNDLQPTTHIFSKSSPKWVGKIKNGVWLNEGPNSQEVDSKRLFSED